MKMKILASMGALSLVVATASVAVAATTSSQQISALASAESHVVSLLHSYKSTSTWRNNFKAAIALQTADIAKLNAVLSPAHSSGALFSQSASGAQTTAPFTVPASAKGWRVAWSYNCASFGGSGNFIVEVFQGTNMSFTDSGVNQLGSKGSGTQHYYDTGSFHLEINSECAWTIKVLPGN